MFLKTVEKSVQKFVQFRNQILSIFFSIPGLAWKAAFKKINVKPEQLKDNDMSLMVEKGIRWEICHSKNRYAKPNNKYMKDFDKK